MSIDGSIAELRDIAVTFIGTPRQPARVQRILSGA
jgi:hypothetical protein